ncbi:uncharacterized protein LOC118424401 [Branchiostoma floridae]|uniref:Uncharacterized protein LOC118424401 n=1 Tax=Branchiostoma floridae TaxID=7739 RepID=A0A9J7N414_BRAFL|nr:uncharacterized protein LOC118424401 [Branchiostoma floridae]
MASISKRRRKTTLGFFVPGTKVTIYDDNGRKRTHWVQVNPGGTSTARPTTSTSTTSTATDQHLAQSSEASEIPVEPASYTQIKEALKEAWAEKRDDLIKTAIQSAVPPTSMCYLCEEEVLTAPLIFCKDCSPLGVFCFRCFEKIHKSPSLHCAEEWKDGCFQPYVYNRPLVLPHQKNCHSSSYKPLRVFDQNGRLQHLDVAVCRCGYETELQTLLKLGLWGATPTNPKTAFSVSLLEWLVWLCREAQVSTLAFCKAVRWKNDLTLNEMNSLHRALTGECIAEFRHFQHRLESMKDLSPSLDGGISCPACPKNDGEQIIAIDANFGLVRKASSGTSSAPPLHGQSMFLEDEKLKEFLADYYDEEKPSEDCSHFKAGQCLRSKAQHQKLDVTGVFGSVCRHNIPLKFLNMFHGERFGYPVFLIRNLLRDAKLRNIKLKIIYDVACSLKAHLRKSKDKEIKEMLPQLSLAVDVFHSYGHTPLCQVQYNTRRLEGYGLTDGEGVESLWSYLRRFARITKEMTPAHRFEKLSDALVHFAMRKAIDIEVTLKDKMRNTKMTETIADENLKEAMSHAGVPVSLDDIKRWQEMETELMKKKKQPSTSTCAKWMKEYAGKLVRHHKLGKKIQECQDDSALQVHHSAFLKLESTLKGIEGEHGITRWQQSSPEFKAALKDLDIEERKQRLSTLQSVSCQRSFLISLKGRYPDGQEIALKLSKQIRSTNNKLSKAIQAYNTIPWSPQTGEFPPRLNFSQATDPTWATYQMLGPSMSEPGLPYSIKRKAIDAVSMKERAAEERQMIKEEMVRVWRHFQGEYDCTEKAVRHCQQNDSMKAEQAMLLQHVIRLEKRLSRMHGVFKQFIVLPDPPSSHIPMYSDLVLDSSEAEYISVDDYEEYFSEEEEEEGEEEEGEI